MEDSSPPTRTWLALAAVSTPGLQGKSALVHMWPGLGGASGSQEDGIMSLGFFWPAIIEAVKAHCSSCPICQKYNSQACCWAHSFHVSCLQCTVFDMQHLPCTAVLQLPVSLKEKVQNSDAAVFSWLVVTNLFYCFQLYLAGSISSWVGVSMSYLFGWKENKWPNFILLKTVISYYAMKLDCTEFVLQWVLLP